MKLCETTTHILRQWRVCAVAILASCSSTSFPPLKHPTAAVTAPPHGQAVVVWISVDGNRFDYVERAHAPLLTKLMREGAYTKQLTPAFPSITFASHTTEVTGAYEDAHGIPANGFYDVATKQKYSFPNQSSLVRAEQIWITAERQGVRAAVMDWPLSSQEAGPIKADYFTTGYNNDLTDLQRTQAMIDVWANDQNPNPLRLLIGYTHDTDVAGHKYGPDAPETLDALRGDDAVLTTILGEAEVLFDKRMKPEDELYFIVTTDHGMSTVKSHLNLDRMVGGDNLKNAVVVNSGPISNIYLSNLPVDQRATRVNDILAKLKTEEFVEAYARNDLPTRWHYNDPQRVGDVVVIAKPGYAWGSMRSAATVSNAVSGQRGNHGYDVQEDPEMRGFAVIWRYRHPFGGIDLGQVDTVQIEPTVAKILGIQPAATAVGKAIALP